MTKRTPSSSRQETEETFILTGRFDYPPPSPVIHQKEPGYDLSLSTGPKGPPDRAVGTLALIRWLREGSVDAIQPLRPDLTAGSGALSIEPFEHAFQSELAAAFLQVFANDIAQRRGWLVIFDQARTSGDKSGVTLEALARVRRLDGDTPASQEAGPPEIKARDVLKPRRSRAVSLSVLLALGLSAIGPTASAIEQYPKVRAGAVSMAEDLKQAVLDVAAIFSKLLNLSYATVTFEKASPEVAESFVQKC